MKRACVWLASGVLFGIALTPSVKADAVAPPFNGLYTLSNLGTPTGVPGLLGGLVFLDDNHLLVGGNANGGGGGIYEIAVTRDGSGHVDGFSGGASLYASAPNIDGGLIFAPNGDLLYTGYSTNTLGEIKPGSTAPDKIVNLSASGVASSVGSVQFAPNGDFKIASYSSGGFYTAALTPDGSGTYDVGSATLNATPGGGPEGIVYVPLGSPGFGVPSMLMAQYSAGRVETYQVDGSFNPIVGSGQEFITGISGAEGSAIDPLTNDFLFATFGSGNHIDVVSGFAPPPSVPEPSYLIFSSAVLGLIVVGRSVRRKRNG